MATEGIHPEAVVTALRDEGSVTAASRVLGLNRNTLSSYLHRHNIDVSHGAQHATWDGSTADPVEQVLSENTAEWGDIRKLVESRGLTPEDWVLSRCRINKWGENEQLRADLEPRRDFLMPARTDGWKPPKPSKSQKATKGLIFAFGDQHVPHHSVELHANACQMLRDHKPEQLILCGDLLDYAAVSRWRKTGNEAQIQETVDTGWNVVRDYVEASPGTRVRFVDGNHEERLPNLLADKGLGPVARVRRANDVVPVLSTGHLLRFDELKIEQVFPPGGADWKQAEIRVLPNLAARHGGTIKKESGASGVAMLKQTRRNIVIGDTHRQSIVFHTWWDIDNRQHQLMALETGTMADVDHTGLNYASEPDWMMGFGVIQVVGDRFSPELATFVDGKLRWRNHEYSV